MEAKDKPVKLYTEDLVKGVVAEAKKAGIREAQDGIWDKVMGAKKSGFDEGRQEGTKEVMEWIECNLIYLALEYDGTPALHLQTNKHKSAEKWQAFKKERGIE